MKRIVLISCVSQKLPHRAKAKNIYISTLFKLNLRYAEKLNTDSVYILSAKYGSLNLEQEIDPYEQALNNMQVNEVKRWANQVIEQIKKICVIEETEFIFLAGEKYRKYLLPQLNNVQIPLKGLRIGEQLQMLKTLTAGVRNERKSYTR